MKRFKQIGAGLILALLLVFTINSRAEAVADFKACWTTGAPENLLLVNYFSFVGEDTYSINGKVLDPLGAPHLLFSGTMVFGTTEAVGSIALTQFGDPNFLVGNLSTMTLTWRH